MDKFLSSHFGSESPEYYPEDFQGAAPGDGIICISSDDEMECASSASVDDLESLSDDDEVALLAECIERQMELPLASESIPLPSCSNQQRENRDEMECASSASGDDLEPLSDDDEVALLAECIERQMELPLASESIPVPSCSNQQRENRAGTARLSYIPGPMFDAGYFDLGMGRGQLVFYLQ